MTQAIWRKSSWSGGNGGNCVEVAALAGSAEMGERVVAVRDSKDPDGPKLVFTAAQWAEFTSGIRAGAPGSR